MFGRGRVMVSVAILLAMVNMAAIMASGEALQAPPMPEYTTTPLQVPNHGLGVPKQPYQHARNVREAGFQAPRRTQPPRGYGESSVLEERSRVHESRQERMQRRHAQREQARRQLAQRRDEQAGQQWRPRTVHEQVRSPERFSALEERAHARRASAQVGTKAQVEAEVVETFQTLTKVAASFLEKLHDDVTEDTEDHDVERERMERIKQRGGRLFNKKEEHRHRRPVMMEMASRRERGRFAENRNLPQDTGAISMLQMDEKKDDILEDLFKPVTVQVEVGSMTQGKHKANQRVHQRISEHLRHRNRRVVRAQSRHRLSARQRTQARRGVLEKLTLMRNDYGPRNLAAIHHPHPVPLSSTTNVEVNMPTQEPEFVEMGSKQQADGRKWVHMPQRIPRDRRGFQYPQQRSQQQPQPGLVETGAQAHVEDKAQTQFLFKSVSKFVGGLFGGKKGGGGNDLRSKAMKIEDCAGCKMIWQQVEMDVGSARYVEDVQASFEHNCMDAQKSTIFYAVCEDMYDDMYAMTDDYMSNKFKPSKMCQRAKICGKKKGGGFLRGL